MRLLLDQGTPRSAAAILRELGHDAIHTGEAGLAEAEDFEIITRAEVEGRIVVTLDADFHALLALRQMEKPSVIRIRVEGLKAEDFSSLLRKVLEECREDLTSGALISVTDTQIRVRRMPLP